jgi:hypothetical protein
VKKVRWSWRRGKQGSDLSGGLVLAVLLEHNWYHRVGGTLRLDFFPHTYTPPGLLFFLCVFWFHFNGFLYDIFIHVYNVC